jgi:proline dehydrogenase
VNRRSVARFAARRYVAGASIEDAVRAAARYAAAGFGTTIGYWDGPDETPRSARDRNLEAVRTLAAGGLDTYLSLKAKALGYDPACVEPVTDAARAAGMRVHFDSIDPAGAAPSLELAAAARGAGAEVGFSLPGRWRRSLDDADAAVELGLAVRVVKGERDETGSPAPPQSGRREDFLTVVERVAGRAPLVAVATHDASLARAALELLQRCGAPCELELLAVFPLEPARSVAQALGVPVRIYVSFGYPWLPYGLRHVARSPRVLGWLARDLLRGHA